jgi:hypothetical protein
MGQWVITIKGTGVHHNNGNPNDADVIAAEVVNKLIDAGQQLEAASFTAGSRINFATKKA